MLDDRNIIKGIGGKTGSAMWAEIEDLLKRWARKNPRAANLNRYYNQETRDNLYDKKYGTLNNEGMAGGRLVLSIHPELVNYIEVFYPKFFESKDNVRHFARTYKMFAIAEDV